MRQSHPASDFSYSWLYAPLPDVINWSAFGYIVLVAMKWLTLVFFLLNWENIVEAIRGIDSGLSLIQIEERVNTVQLLFNVSHVVFGIVYAFIAYMMYQIRHLVRVTSIIVFVLAVLETIYIWSLLINMLPGYSLPSSIHMITIQIVILCINAGCVSLLWFTRSSRHFFATLR